jgi:hypothetical protein
VATGPKNVQRLSISIKDSSLTLVDDKLSAHLDPPLSMFRDPLDNSASHFTGYLYHFR